MPHLGADGVWHRGNVYSLDTLIARHWAHAAERRHSP